jgi:hypothetical protein
VSGPDQGTDITEMVSKVNRIIEAVQRSTQRGHHCDRASDRLDASGGVQVVRGAAVEFHRVMCVW